MFLLPYVPNSLGSILRVTMEYFFSFVLCCGLHQDSPYKGLLHQYLGYLKITGSFGSCRGEENLTLISKGRSLGTWYERVHNPPSGSFLLCFLAALKWAIFLCPGPATRLFLCLSLYNMYKNSAVDQNKPHLHCIAGVKYFVQVLKKVIKILYVKHEEGKVTKLSFQSARNWDCWFPENSIAFFGRYKI